MTLRKVLTIILACMGKIHNNQHFPKTKVISTTDIETGSELEIEVSTSNAQDQCYQFTWVGLAENENFTTSSTCLDFESDFNSLFGRSVPCFHPLVWTIDDGDGMNGPILEEIEQQCQETGCDPFCSRGGAMCMKYSVKERNKDKTVRWESHFCGSGVKWDGSGISHGRCYGEDNVEGKDHKICLCNDMSKCNGAQNIKFTSMIILLNAIFILNAIL